MKIALIPLLAGLSSSALAQNFTLWLEPSSPTPVSSMVRSGPAIPMRALMALMEASVHAMPAGLRGKEAYPCRFPENERPQLRFA